MRPDLSEDEDEALLRPFDDQDEARWIIGGMLFVLVVVPLTCWWLVN